MFGLQIDVDDFLAVAFGGLLGFFTDRKCDFLTIVAVMSILNDFDILLHANIRLTNPF